MWSISMLRHEAPSPHHLNIQFPIYTKLLTHVEGVTLNTSMHQYCVIPISATHWTQEVRQTSSDLHDIHDMTICVNLLSRNGDFRPPLSVKKLSLPAVQLFEEGHDLLVLDLKKTSKYAVTALSACSCVIKWSVKHRLGFRRSEIEICCKRQVQ